MIRFEPVIIDLGIGNTGSLTNALKFLGIDSSLGSSPEQLSKASHLLLPGVGAFDPAMKEIDRHGLRPLLNQLVMEEQKPVFGICLGMQLLFEGSHEGKHPGLGFIPGTLERLPPNRDQGIKVPHAGFSSVQLEQTTGFFDDMAEEQCFYFTHSYAMRAEAVNFEVAICEYGFPFVAAFKRNNIYGAQFHPEKSQNAGLRCLVNFFEGTASR